MVAAPFGLAITDMLTPEAVAAELGKVIRPNVIWLHFQDCTGCTETLLRTSHPVLRAEPVASGAVVAGSVGERPAGVVTLRTRIGSTRVLDMLSREQLPRIC